MNGFTENFLEEYLQDLAFDAEYLDWKREQELRAWHQFVDMKEAEEEAYNLMAEKHFKLMEMYEMILPSEIDEPEEEIEYEPFDFSK